jgi:hypothetical protein
MTLTFVRRRNPTNLDDLSPIEVEQLVAAGKRYDGQDRRAEERLGLVNDELIEMDDDAKDEAAADEVDASDDEVDDDDPTLWQLEVWDLEDEAGDTAYRIWIHNVDSASVFRAATTEIVADFVQFSLECEDDELRAELVAARGALGDLDEQVGLASLDFE